MCTGFETYFPGFCTALQMNSDVACLFMSEIDFQTRLKTPALSYIHIITVDAHLGIGKRDVKYKQQEV